MPKKAQIDKFRMRRARSKQATASVISMMCWRRSPNRLRTLKRGQSNRLRKSSSKHLRDPIVGDTACPRHVALFVPAYSATKRFRGRLGVL